MHLYPINGACHRVAADDTAFAYRDATFAPVIVGRLAGPRRRTRRASSGCATTTRRLAPHSEPGGYINFMPDDDQGRIQDNYRENYTRLVEVKRTYDPDNLFHLNQNIKP